jgi:glycosyltransferase involved in cell wall biosynthesis
MRISVVIPSFNQAAYLRATLESVCSQDHADVEILVRDGGSTDGSVEILRTWSTRPGYHAIDWRSRPDHGQSDAINQGLRASTGDVLAYLNSDDVYYPGALSTVAAYFEAHPDCLALYGRAHHLHADGTVMEEYPTQSWDYDRLLETCYLCQPAVFWRREVMERYGVFDDSLHFGLDYEYWLRVGHDHPFHYLAGGYLAGSRLHEETKTLSQRVPFHRELVGVVKKYAQRPEPVLHWIKHLAHHRGFESESQDPDNPAGRQRFVAAMVSHCLADAAAVEVPLTDAFLQGLEDDLASVGL